MEKQIKKSVVDQRKNLRENKQIDLTNIGVSNTASSINH